MVTITSMQTYGGAIKRYTEYMGFTIHPTKVHYLENKKNFSKRKEGQYIVMIYSELLHIHGDCSTASFHSPSHPDLVLFALSIKFLFSQQQEHPENQPFSLALLHI